MVQLVPPTHPPPTPRTLKCLKRMGMYLATSRSNTFWSIRAPTCQDSARSREPAPAR